MKLLSESDLQQLWLAILLDDGSESIIRKIERELIIFGLNKTRGNQRALARVLKTPKSTLHDRINAHEIVKLKHYDSFINGLYDNLPMAK